MTKKQLEKEIERLKKLRDSLFYEIGNGKVWYRDVLEVDDHIKNLKKNIKEIEGRNERA